jgi:hypothetical protein
MSNREARGMATGSDVVPEGVDPNESPFALPPVFEGFPFARDGEEAKAIREVIEQADRERAVATEERR